MQTQYNVSDDQRWLAKLLGMAIIFTDGVYDHVNLVKDGHVGVAPEYILFLLEARANAHKFLQQQDFNEEINALIKAGMLKLITKE